MARNERLTCTKMDQDIEAGFELIRTELDVPASFPGEVIEQAESAAKRGPQLPPGAGGTRIEDRRDLNLVAIDPPGSRDLDQAYHAERRGDGYRLHYAIADVAAFVTPGSALDDEALRRGVTLYSPDIRASLHPEAINENAGSLLAGQDRQSLLWTIDLDSDGNATSAHVGRASVRATRNISYRTAQTEIDSGEADSSLALLATIGGLRQELERDRGAVSLQLPSQEIIRRDGQWDLVYDESLPVEGWNAQISLLTGIQAAHLMAEAGVGLLRTLPPPREETIDRIRRIAKALEIDWPADVSYADRVRTLTTVDPREAALLNASARGLRGAGYVAFADGALPEMSQHSAIASMYAHVTAPLRRVCDRFTNEVLLAICADREPPEWAVGALDQLPAIMGKAKQRDRSLERSLVDMAEALWLENRVGEVFSAVVTDIGRDWATLMVRDPAVISSIRDTSLELGSVVQVRLEAADQERRRLTWQLVDQRM